MKKLGLPMTREVYLDLSSWVIREKNSVTDGSSAARRGSDLEL